METFHRVSSKEADIEAVLVVRVDAHAVHLFNRKVYYFVSDLEAKDQLVWKSIRQLKAETTITASNIKDLWHQISRFVNILFCIFDRVLLRVSNHPVPVVVCDAELTWIVK